MSTKSSGEAEASSPKPKGGEESEEESEVLEESPCGRWQKRREEVLILSLISPYYVVEQSSINRNEPSMRKVLSTFVFVMLNGR